MKYFGEHIMSVLADENKCKVHGRNYIAVENKHAISNCVKCAFREDVEGCSKAPFCAHFTRKDNRNVYFIRETTK